MKGITVRNNHIQITLSFNNRKYSKTLRISPSTSNLKYAQRQREAWLHELTLGSTPEAFQKKESLLISSLLTEWLKEKENDVKASTYDDYRKSVSLLKIHFGSFNVADLKITDIKNFCNNSDAGAKRLNNLLSPLRQVLQEAVDGDDHASLTRNILKGWACKKKNGEYLKRINPFNIDEQRAILSVLTGQSKNLIQFAFWTGLRTSEYIALKWSDVNFDNRTVNIVRARTQAGKVAEVPKTSAGERTIKLLDHAYSALLAQKEFTFDLNEEIFHHPKYNIPWKGDQQIRKTLWIPAIKEAGVLYRNPYQTRHTYASMMLSAGEHPMWVATQMGHADWRMIGKIYGKWMPDAMPKSGQKAEAVFGIKS